ncbi:MAG: serine/threonine protein kinase [Gemmatimonadales bacterium]|nr:serine/threonine protein kinase [Gemmatimonadales bacterium]
MTMTPERWRTVKALFDGALDQPSDSRDQWLAEATAGDDPLRREVESLLEALREERDRFERPPVLSLEDVIRGEIAGAAAPEVGTRVGSYRLIRVIGQGGMGTVFEATRDDDQYRKRVAIKTIARGRDSELILRRFRYERQILARLDHKNIAGLLDGGVTDRGQPYFAMEYVEGRPIDQYCDARRLDVRARLQLFRQVAAAVQYAHQNLVIHRDLKPSNILVTDDGTVKLLDFGIAKLLREDDGSDGQGLTQPGMIPLTTAYASPEQVRGEAVTTGTDIFSLGLVLYKLLAGQHPFAHDLAAGDIVRRRICEDTPPPPSAVVTADTASVAEPSGLKRLRRTLSGDLDAIVLMALRKEQARRYASVEQFGEDILRYLAGLPVVAQPDSLGYRLGKLVRRNRAAAMAAAVAIVALAAGLLSTAWQARLARQERDRAQLEAAKATRVTRFVQEMLGSADPRSAGRDVTVAEALGLAVQRADTELAAEPDIHAAVLSTIGRTYLALGRYDEAEPALRRALALEREAEARNPNAVTSELRTLAALEAERGEIAKAEPLFQEALGRARRPPVDSALLGQVLDGYGALMLDKGEFAQAEEIHREALDLRRALLGTDHADVVNSLNNLAVALGQQAKWREALPRHLEAVTILKRLHPEGHPDLAAAMNSLANAYTIVGDYAAADTLFPQVLAQRVKFFGEHHSEVAWTHYSYADLLRLKGDYPAAVSEARAVLASRGAGLPDSHPMVHSALHVLGRSYLALGRAREAEPVLRESLTLRASAYPPGHWLTASAQSALGECLLALGKYRDAEPLLVKAHEDLKTGRGETDRRTVETAALLKRLYIATGRPAEAARYR